MGHLLTQSNKSIFFQLSAAFTALAIFHDWSILKQIGGGLTGLSLFLIFIGWGTSWGAGNKEPL